MIVCPTQTNDPTRENPYDIFCNIGRTLTSSLNPQEVFRQVMELIGSHFSPRYWSLLLMEENTGKLKFEIVMGVNAGRLKNFYLEKNEGIAGWVCQHAVPLVIGDVRNDSRFSPRVDHLLGFTTRSVVCVPLLNGKNRVVGAIELINKIPPNPMTGDSRSPTGTPREIFNELDMQILAAIGAFTGIAAENAFLHQKVRELAMIDPLTGISNRHYFNEMLNREIERVKRYNHTICLLMMDMDGLKRINDRHGHLTGDAALRTIAEILRTSIRESDVVARFGGDEFAILMPFADEDEGFQLARRIQEKIAEWNSNSTDFEGIHLGLSIGVHAADPKNVDQVLMNADQELYRCKNFRRKPEELTSENQLRRYLWYNLFSEDK